MNGFIDAGITKALNDEDINDGPSDSEDMAATTTFEESDDDDENYAH